MLCSSTRTVAQRTHWNICGKSSTNFYHVAEAWLMMKLIAGLTASSLVQFTLSTVALSIRNTIITRYTAPMVDTICNSLCNSSCKSKIALVHWDLSSFTFDHLTSKAYQPASI